MECSYPSFPRGAFADSSGLCVEISNNNSRTEEFGSCKESERMEIVGNFRVFPVGTSCVRGKIASDPAERCAGKTC